jgi:hypothetical protein
MELFCSLENDVVHQNFPQFSNQGDITFLKNYRPSFKARLKIENK